LSCARENVRNIRGMVEHPKAGGHFGPVFSL
jgi:hypothetical protein